MSQVDDDLAQMNLFQIEPEVLLRLGAEGGSWTLLREKDRESRVSYSIILNQAVFDDLEPSGAPHSRHWRGVDLRDAILELSKDCPFTRFVPLSVHRDVVPALRALRDFERALGEEEMAASRWDEALGAGGYRW